MLADVFFRVSFLLLYLGFFVMRIYFDGRIKKFAVQTESETWREGLAVILLRRASFLIYSSVVFLFLIYPRVLRWSLLPLPRWTRYLGLVLMIITLLWLLWVHNTLDIYWTRSLRIRKDHRMIIRGPYRYIRHPMYLGFVMFAGATALIINSWCLIVSFVLEVIKFGIRIQKEERMLVHRFGADYETYTRTTGRLVPSVFRKSSVLSTK